MAQVGHTLSASKCTPFSDAVQSRPRGTTFWVIRHTWQIHEQTTVELNEEPVSGRIQAQTLRGDWKNTFMINKPINPWGLLNWFCAACRLLGSGS